MTQPKSAMVMAAGMGSRMAHLTEHRPKPLVEVGGRALIDYAIERLVEAGVEKIVINVHYKAELLIDHFAGRTEAEFVISDERGELLETGGGIVKALDHFEDQPFFVHNSDSVWIETGAPNLTRMAQEWDDARMDCLMLLAPTNASLGFTGKGDFHKAPDGTLARRRSEEIAEFVWNGVQIIHPRLFANAPQGAFSTNLVWDHAIEASRLFGSRLEGTWMHIGDPQAVQAAEDFIAERGYR